jgi:hypothetical protein
MPTHEEGHRIKVARASFFDIQNCMIVVSSALSRDGASIKVAHVLFFLMVRQRPSFPHLFCLMDLESALAKQKLICVLPFYFYFSCSSHYFN